MAAPAQRADLDTIRSMELRPAGPGRRIAIGLVAATGALLAPAVVAASDAPKELEQISASLRAGEISAALALCDAVPRRWYDLSARLPTGMSRTPQPGKYATLYSRCAVASLRGGDIAVASWRWQMAQVFDARLAMSVAVELGAFGELPAARHAGDRLPTASLAESKRWRELDTWLLGAPDDAFRPNVNDHSRFRLRGGFKCRLGLEAILGGDGKLREPVVVERQSCVLDQVSVVLDALGRRRYPAVRDERGAAQEVAYRLLLSERGE